MSRKDYVLIARTLRGLFVSNDARKVAPDWSAGYERALHDVVDALAAEFNMENPRFDYDKFRAAARGTSA